MDSNFKLKTVTVTEEQWAEIVFQLNTTLLASAHNFVRSFPGKDMFVNGDKERSARTIQRSIYHTLKRFEKETT